MSDPRGVTGNPANVRKSRKWIWLVPAVIIALALIMILARSFTDGGAGGTRIDSAPGTATDASTGAVGRDPAPPLAAGGGEAGTAPAGPTTYGQTAGVATGDSGSQAQPSASQ